MKFLNSYLTIGARRKRIGELDQRASCQTGGLFKTPLRKDSRRSGGPAPPVQSSPDYVRLKYDSGANLQVATPQIEGSRLNGDRGLAGLVGVPSPCGNSTA